MSNNQTKNNHLISIFNSGFKKRIAWNPDYKDTEHTPAYLMKNFSHYIEDKQAIRIKNMSQAIINLNKYNNIIQDFYLNNNSLNFIAEVKRLEKETLNSKLNKSNTKLQSEEIQLINNLKNRYINNNLNNQINFPLNLFIKNNLNNKDSFSLRNYIKLITKFYPNLASSKNNLFKFNLHNTKFYTNIYTLLHSAFLSMHCLISKPRISYLNDKIFIKLFFFADVKLSKLISKILKHYKNKNRSFIFNNKYRNRKNLAKKIYNNNFIINNYKSPFVNIYKKQLNILCQLLSKLFNKPVQLELIRLHYPFYDPNILVNLLANFTNFTNLRKLFISCFNVALIKRPTANVYRKRFSLLPGYLTGLTIKFAGRFPTQKVIPRKTVKYKEIGSLARKKAILVENARFSNKNRRGSFSISVSTGLHLGNYIR